MRCRVKDGIVDESGMTVDASGVVVVRGWGFDLAAGHSDAVYGQLSCLSEYTSTAKSKARQALSVNVNRVWRFPRDEGL